MRIAPFGESAILVTFADAIDPAANVRARALADAWEDTGLGRAVPAYASTLLRFDPLVLAPDAAARRARGLATRAKASPVSSGRLIEIPATYDGPDLAEVARLSGLGASELVALHSAREYVAYFLGFSPGFAYLGDLDPRIVAPRLDAPRPRVPAGSIGVAGNQTCVYPHSTPGGWRLVARTDVALFDARRDPPSLIAPGDRVRFVPA